MHPFDYMEIGDDMEEDVEDVRERLEDLAPYLLLNRSLAMDSDKMPDMHKTFAHLSPLVKKIDTKRSRTGDKQVQ